MTPFLHHHQALESTGAQMLAAAHKGHWTEVTRLEAVALAQVAIYRATPASMPDTLEVRQARLKALKAILRLDAQVRTLAEPVWHQMERCMGTTNVINGQAGAYFADNLDKH